MITAKRIPIDKNPLAFTSDELKKLDGNRVCAVVPTSRNLRSLANEGFKTVELFTAKDFTSFANLASGIRIPKQLRPFYLRTAARESSKKDKVTLFKSDGSIFLENFGAFAQASVSIFSFYRELSSEMVDMERLASAGKYTDYEEQIKALKRLWINYLKLIAKDGWTDEWEDLKNPLFRKDFIDRYDEFVFLIGGYLTKYELKQLEQVGKFKNVSLIFNYAGSKYALHKQYEDSLNITLDDRPLKPLTPSSCNIVACSGMAAQLELITRQAFAFEKNGIDFKQMAVLIPDEHVKTYFLRLDPYNLFDITSNENIDAYPPYSVARLIMEIASDMKKSKTKSADIVKIASVFGSPAVKKIIETENISKELDEKIARGKLYLSHDEVLKLPFFMDFAPAAFKAPPRLTPKKTALIFREIFKKFELTCDKKDFALNEIISRLEALEAIYEKIDEEIEFEENLKMILAETSDIKIDTPKGKIPVMGILESRNLAFDALFIPAMNEDIFPPASKKDLFLNTEIRKELELPTFIDRENLMKNYLLQIMEKAKVCLITYDNNNNSRRRSRFVEEIVVKNRLSAQTFAPKAISLLSGKEGFFPDDNEIIVEKNEKIIEDLKNTVFSATAFNDYLTCPLRFYFKRVDFVSPKNEPQEKIASIHIGNAFHKALEALHANKIKPDAKEYNDSFIKIYRSELSRYDAYLANATERFRAYQAEMGIPKIAIAEANRIGEGYTIVNREKKIEAEFLGYKIKGTIDRIDEKGGRYDIIDYKFKEVSKPPNNFIIETQKDLQMPFYALLLETSQKIVPENLYYFDLKNSFRLVGAFDMCYYDKFKEFAERKFAEINSPDIPFTKTSKISNCVYCDYAVVCGREQR